MRNKFHLKNRHALRAILVFFVLTFGTQYAVAADPVPGASCSGFPANAWQWSGGPEQGGTLYGMFCNTTWGNNITFKTGGNIGLGTISPVRTLHIYNGTTDEQIVVESDESHEAGLELLSKGPNGGAVLGDTGTKGWEIYTRGDLAPAANRFFLTFWDGSGWTTMFQIDGINNRIGINMNDYTSPQATLDVNGYVRLAKYSAQPIACSSTYDGSLALSHNYTLCVCKGGSSSWVLSSNGSTACSW